jgi:hypothetical protein
MDFIFVNNFCKNVDTAVILDTRYDIIPFLSSKYTIDHNQCLTHAEISNGKNCNTQWPVVMFRSAIVFSASGHIP